MFIRALGFNIKKFDFSRDAQELNLTNEDNAEIEVNIGINTTDITRGLRKKGREVGYFYQEFIIYIISILVILFVIIIFNGIQVYNKKYKVYSHNEYVGNNIRFSVIDSYFSVVDDDNLYVIVKFNAYNNGRNSVINTGNIVLNVGEEKYFPDKNNCYKFKKYGNCYKQQYVTNDEKSYILTYKVDDLNLNKSYIVFNESYDIKYKIKLDVENIDY